MGLLSKLGFVAKAAVEGNAIKDSLDSAGNLSIKVRQAITGEISPDQKAELEMAVQSMDDSLSNARLEIVKAESTSIYKSVVLARPLFLYVMYIFLIVSLFVGLVSMFDPQYGINFATGMKMYLNAIPDDAWFLFGTGYLGYATVRTVDKKNNSASK